MSDTYSMIMTTTDSIDVARKVARLLVSQKLAACVQQSKVESIYEWKGEVETGEEIILLIKCRAEDYTAIEQCIKANHNYSEPEIISIRIERGSTGYLSWIKDTTAR